jgi:hypothetical protein
MGSHPNNGKVVEGWYDNNKCREVHGMVTIDNPHGEDAFYPNISLLFCVTAKN